MKVGVKCGNVISEVYSESIGPFSENTQLQDEQVGFPKSTNISGKVIGCDNASLSGTYVVAGNQIYMTDASRNYSLSACGNSLTLTPYRNNPWTQGKNQCFEWRKHNGKPTDL
jgi:hypothetical protein